MKLTFTVHINRVLLYNYVCNKYNFSSRIICIGINNRIMCISYNNFTFLLMIQLKPTVNI